MFRATENTATVQALLDNQVSRGLDPTMPRLLIVDGAKALSRAIRRTFGFGRCDPALPDPQGAQHHGTLPKEHHAANRRGAALGLVPLHSDYDSSCGNAYFSLDVIVIAPLVKPAQ